MPGEDRDAEDIADIGGICIIDYGLKLEKLRRRMRDFSEDQLSGYARFSENLRSTHDRNRRREIVIDFLRELAASANDFADKAMRTLVKLQDFCLSKIELDGERRLMELSSQLIEEVDHVSHMLQQSRLESQMSEEENRRKFEEEKAALEVSIREELEKCRICKQNTRNAVVLPCMHAQFCKECLEQNGRGNIRNCSVCGSHIRSILHYIT
ncbi:hypothetical protein KP509_30G038300 [Ceratopteris richardii]|nr:hypothetical protein KP509_30G038300 [Ceratopteris richardii]